LNKSGKAEVYDVDENQTHCVVRVGSNGRDDPDTEIHVVKQSGDEWARVARTFVNGQKTHKFELEPGNYHVMVIGDKTAGVVTTATLKIELPFPFDIFMDPPEDHGKDFMRLDLPANVPVTPTLEKAIKAALRET
jgi:hypothetical protein